MLTGFRWLALEAWYLDRAREFYERHLGALVVRETDSEVVLDVGGSALVLREPGPVPRGGVHVHYALATPPACYDDWWDHLADDFDLDEVSFGGARSLYFYDPDDHCVEIGQYGVGDATPSGTDVSLAGGWGGAGEEDGAGVEDDTDGDEAPAHPLSGIFEVVLEVESLDPAVSFYRDLGFSVTDRGADRQRVRLTGPVDLELWEPQRGLADARGGVHVDLGFGANDPAAAAAAVEDRICDREALPDGVRVRDPDGHYLTFVETE